MELIEKGRFLLLCFQILNESNCLSFFSIKKESTIVKLHKRTFSDEDVKQLTSFKTLTILYRFCKFC